MQKYLYLLFDDHHPLHQANAPAHLFTTEGHLLPILAQFRHYDDGDLSVHPGEIKYRPSDGPVRSLLAGSRSNRTELSCARVGQMTRPLAAQQQQLINDFVGLKGWYY